MFEYDFLTNFLYVTCYFPLAREAAAATTFKAYGSVSAFLNIRVGTIMHADGAFSM